MGRTEIHYHNITGVCILIVERAIELIEYDIYILHIVVSCERYDPVILAGIECSVEITA